MVWVLGLVSLLKFIIMVCPRSDICEYLTYGLLIHVSVINFSHAMFVSVTSVYTYFDPVSFYENW
jgi:hypothetical protein